MSSSSFKRFNFAAAFWALCYHGNFSLNVKTILYKMISKVYPKKDDYHEDEDVSRRNSCYTISSVETADTFLSYITNDSVIHDPGPAMNEAGEETVGKKKEEQESFKRCNLQTWDCDNNLKVLVSLFAGDLWISNDFPSFLISVQILQNCPRLCLVYDLSEKRILKI